MTWSVLPFQVGLRYNGGDISQARRPSAGAVPGRWGNLLGGKDPTGRLAFWFCRTVSNHPTSCCRSYLSIPAPRRGSPRWPDQSSHLDEHATCCRFPCPPDRTSGGLPPGGGLGLSRSGHLG